MTKDLKYFVEMELYPALFERIDIAFPEMHFKRVRSGWHSPLKMNKTAPKNKRQDKSYINFKYPTLIGEQGGETMNLIDFCQVYRGGRRGEKGTAYLEAVKYLAQCCGLEVPESDPETMRKYQERQKQRDNREKLLEQAKKALFSPEGKKDLEYMKGRGWTEEDIKNADLGFLTPSLREKYKDLGLPGEAYTLLIPYRSNGHLEGFKARNINTEVTSEKYRNTSGLEVSEFPFGMPMLNPEEDEYNLTIVEGELDALHAQVRGIKNVVATTNKLVISQELIDMAKKKGFRMITILVDQEKEEDQDKEKRIEKAIINLNSHGLTPLVALLEGEAGVKVDTDSYLKEHTKEDLEGKISEALNGFAYLYEKREERFYKEKVKEGEFFPRDYENFKKDTISFIVEYNLDLETRGLIINKYRDIFGESLTWEAVEQGINKYLAEKAEKIKTEETRRLLNKAGSMLEGGDTQGAIQCLKDKLEKVESISDQEEIHRLLRGKTSSERKQSLKAGVEGIKTDYLFPKDDKESEPMTLPAGAITLIGGLPSHGKSAFLRNLALQVVNKEKRKGSVLYFSYEEDGDTTYLRFLNLLYGEGINRRGNNIRTLRSFYRGEGNYIPKDKEPKLQEAERILENWTDSHRLIIIDEDLTAGKLKKTIETACTDTLLYPEGVSAVFIDYAQLIYRENNKLQRNEELKMITKDLREVAKKYKLPIVMACQLKREMKDPYSWGIQDIADSADLEREANLIALIWNSSFEVTAGLKDQSKLSDLISQIRKKFRLKGDLGRNSNTSLLVELGKNRDGVRGVTQTFSFNGNTGRVDPDQEKKPQKGGVDND